MSLIFFAFYRTDLVLGCSDTIVRSIGLALDQSRFQDLLGFPLSVSVTERETERAREERHEYLRWTPIPSCRPWWSGDSGGLRA